MRRQPARPGASATASRTGLNMVPCSIFRERPSSIDAAIWVSRELEADVAPFALREIFRVLKPGGQLVFVAVGESARFGPASVRSWRLESRSTRTRCRPLQSIPVPCAKMERKRTVSRRVLAQRFQEEVPETAEGDSDTVDPRLARLRGGKQTTNNPRPRPICPAAKARWTKRETVVDDAVQRGFGGDGWIWISNVLCRWLPDQILRARMA